MRARLMVAVTLSMVLAGAAVARETRTVGPGSDLQTAIDLAPPGSTLVLVGGAVYDGAVTIDKDIELIADQPLGALPTIVEIDRMTWSLLPQTPPQIVGGIVIQTGSVALQGIHVSCNGNSAGVHVQHGQLMLTGCYIFLAVGAGLAVGPGAAATAVGVDIFGSSGYGVVVESGATCSLTSCHLDACHDGGIWCGGLLSADAIRIESSGQLGSPGLANGLTVTGRGRAWLEGSWIGRNTGYGVVADEDGDLSGLGNVVLPSFGQRANELGAAWEGYLPDGFVADGYEEPVAFWWHFAGQEFQLDASLWVPLEADVQEWSSPYARVDGRTSRSLSLLAHRLVALAAASGFDDEVDIVEFVGSFIGQNIVYDYPRFESEEPGYHSPVKTLVAKSGVCRDYALLAATLLDEMGIDAAYVSLPPLSSDGRGHAVVGVRVTGDCDPVYGSVPATCGQHVDVDGKRFFLLETTNNPTPHLGDVPLAFFGEPEVTLAAALYADSSLVRATAEILAIIPKDASTPVERKVVRVTFRNCGAAATAELCIRLQFDPPWRWLGVLAPGESRSFVTVLAPGYSGYALVAEWAAVDREVLGWDIILLRAPGV